MELAYIDINASLRPQRQALLIPDSLSFKWISHYIIPWMTTRWGGKNSFFLPVQQSPSVGLRHPDFWDKLLKVFDPDYLISLGGFSSEFNSFIASRTLTRAELFQYAEDVPKPVAPPYINDIQVARIHKQDGIREVSCFESVGGDDLCDIWFWSIFGRVCPVRSRFEDNEISVKATAHAIEEVIQAAESIAEGKPYRDQESLLSLSMCHLGYRQGRIEPPFHGHWIPPLFIVGDSIDDWAAFQSLSSLYISVFWVPPALMQRYPALLSSIKRRIHNYKGNQPPLVTSLSLSKGDLERALSAFDKVGHYYKFSESRFRLQMPAELHLVNYRIYGEMNNQKSDTTIFKDGMSVARLPYVVPKHFKLGPEDANFIVEVSPLSYSYLAHPYAAPLEVWPTVGAACEEDAKRTYTGGFAYRAGTRVYTPGQDLESLIYSPRLRLPSFREEIDAVAKAKGYSMQNTDKGLAVQRVIELWESNLDAFCDDYFENDSSFLFQAYKEKDGFSASSRKFVRSRCITIKNELFFTLGIRECFEPVLDAVNDERHRYWLEREILLRGVKLKCALCGKPDFYLESEFGAFFSCRNCRSYQAKTIESMNGALEPRYLYRLNPVIASLQQNNSDLVILGVQQLKRRRHRHLAWVSEVEILRKMDNFQQEIDLIANMDGRLILGEAKTGGALCGKQLTKYASLVKDLQVDEFLCISREPWNDQRKCAIESAFTDKGCKVTFLSSIADGTGARTTSVSASSSEGEST